MILDIPSVLRAQLRCNPDGGYYVDLRTIGPDDLAALEKFDADCHESMGEPFLEFRK